MSLRHRILAPLFVTTAALALSACGGDSTAELASPGQTGTNPGTGGGTGGGGGTNPGGGGSAGNCPTLTTPVQVTLATGTTETHCRLPTALAANLTLTAGNIYQLNSRMDVGTSTLESGGGVPATLTVLPGVTVYASNVNAYIVVQHGSKIIADGNASQPIVFTSANDLGYPVTGIAARAPFRGRADQDTNATARGEWGGIVINGLAPTNSPTRVGEGSTGVSGSNQIRGGTNPDDNSGILRYVQVRYAGFDVGLAVGGAAGQNELNGVAFQAVGRGTIVDYLQIHQAYDDAIEMFGGTVNIKHLVVTGTSDDAIDWTDGWTGNLQYALVVMNGNNPTADNGIEADNLSSNNDATPRSNPVLSNVTIIGTNQSGVTGAGGRALFREGTGVRFLNSVLAGSTRTEALDIDGTATYQQANAGNVVFRSLFVSAPKALATDSDDTANTPTLAGLFAQDPNNKLGQTSTLMPQVTGGIAYINGANENATPVFSLSSFGSFFTTPGAIGAVQSQQSNWTLGWTEFLNRA